MARAAASDHSRKRRRRPPPSRKENGFKRVAMLWFGWIMVLLGIAGMFLPILQGFLFLAIGLIILARRSPRVRLLIIRLGRRYPKVRKGIADAKMHERRLRQRIAGWFRRAF